MPHRANEHKKQTPSSWREGEATARQLQWGADSNAPTFRAQARFRPAALADEPSRSLGAARARRTAAADAAALLAPAPPGLGGRPFSIGELAELGR